MKLLKFYAPWCNPCKNQAKVLETIDFPYPVVEINIDENTETAIDYGVRTVPTLILVNAEGETIERLSDSKATKEQLVDQFIK